MLQLFLVLFKCQTCVLIDTVSFSRFTQCSDHCISRFLACIPFSVYTVILLTQLAGSTFSLFFVAFHLAQASDDFQSVASYFSLEDSKDIARFDASTISVFATSVSGFMQIRNMSFA